MKFKEQVRADLSTLKTTLASNTQSLEVHIKRTDTLEKHVFSWKYRILTYASVGTALAALAKALLSFF